CVNHPTRGKVTRGGGHRLPGRKSLYVPRGAQLPTFLENLRAALPMDRPVHTSAAQERTVGRVDDRVHGLPGDVALNPGDACVVFVAHALSVPEGTGQDACGKTRPYAQNLGPRPGM